MSLNSIKPLGMHVMGVIRFASEGQGDEFQQLDQFEILALSHEQPTCDTNWPNLERHLLHDTVAQGAEGQAQGKLQSIPVRLVFNRPESNLFARYEAFDASMNRLACVGDGSQCTRADFATGKVKGETCSGPNSCSYANSDGVKCDLRVRLAVQVEGQDDPLSVFEVQSSGIHTFRAFSAMLRTLSALLGKLRHVPLMLTMHAKSSPAYEFKRFYVADLQLPKGMTLAEAKAKADQGANADTDQGLGFDELEKEIEAMAGERPLSLTDAESSIITFSNPTVERTRVRRTPAAVVLDGSRTIASVIGSAVRQAEECIAAAAGRPVALGAAKGLEGSVVAPLGPVVAATIVTSRERPPTPL
jgi:hypothetical protein